MGDRQKQSFTFEGQGGMHLYAEEWRPTRPPKGIVQIAHGMRESTDYYGEFCAALARAGYGAVIHDARGHGRTAGEAGSTQFLQNAGRIGDGGFARMVEDLHLLTDQIRRGHPGIPVFLLGHSMGSVLARLYAARFGGGIDGLIYSGTTGPAEPDRSLALLDAAKEERLRRGNDAPAVDTPKRLFSHFNDRFAPVKTGCEYMSRDEEMVRRAVESPFAAIPYRCGFYVEFLTAMREMDAEPLLRRIPKTLPVFSVSGDMDPFGDYGQGVRSLFGLYRAQGLRDASFVLYEGGRHEMLRETNRQEVFRDLIGWLDRHVQAQPAGAQEKTG